MELDYLLSTGFRIKELSLVTKNKTEQSLVSFYKELNIFDSILQPCLNGNILIEDSYGLSDAFLLDGNDFLKIHIGKVDDDALDIKRIFRIYKQSNRTSVNQNTETYLLHFISEEYVTSQYTKVGQCFINTTYTDVVIKLLKDYMQVPKQKLKLAFNKSSGVRDAIIIPTYFNPIEAIEHISKLAIDTQQRPCFLFFENIFGYNFVSLSDLLDRESVANINFDPKNLSNSNESMDLFGARYFEVIQQFDILSDIKNGVYSGKFIGYDKHTHETVEVNYDYDSINHPKNSRNNGPSISNLKLIDGDVLGKTSSSRLITGRTNILHEQLKETEGDTPGIPYEQILFQRTAIFAHLFSQRVKVVVPGNFTVTSGSNIYLNVPKFSQKISEENNLDKTLYGHYLIIAARHKLTPDNKHETIFEACTNSSNRSGNKNKMIGMTSSTNQNYGLK
jgi:hypothetical protein